MNGVIEGYIGPEGAGKTLVMSYFATRCAAAGMRMLAFPGYQLKDRKGRVVTEEITPLNFLKQFQDMINVCLVITEITNYGIDAYNFNGIIPRIFSNAAAMRRKLGLVILYDVQNFSMIPPRIRFLTHTLMFCKDSYWGKQYSENPIPRGVSIQTRRMDCKGFYTGREGWLGRTQYLNHCDDMWGRFESTAIVDVQWALKRYKREDLMVQGAVPETANPIDGPEMEFMQANLKQSVSGLSSNRSLSNEEAAVLIANWVREVREQNIYELPCNIVRDRLSTLGVKLSNKSLGIHLRACGVTYYQDRMDNYYRFS